MVNKPQKFFSLVLFSLARGGAEKAAITIANELIKNNDYNVRVVTLDHNTHLIKELSSKIKYIRLYTIKKYPLLLYISSIFSLFIFMLFQRKHTILAFAEWPSIVVPASNFLLLRKHNVIFERSGTLWIPHIFQNICQVLLLYSQFYNLFLTRNN